MTELVDTPRFPADSWPLAIIFDLDGTLIDSRNQIGAATQVTRQKFSLVPATQTQLNEWFGMKPEFFFFDLPEANRPDAISAFRDELNDSQVIAPPFPEVAVALDSLLQKGIALAVATTKPTWLAHNVLKQSGLLEYFTHVQGTDNFAAKPSPEVFLACLQNLRVDNAKKVWGIGDRIEDAKAARSAGLSPIGLIRNATDPTPPEYHRAGAVTTVTNLEGLLTLIEGQVL